MQFAVPITVLALAPLLAVSPFLASSPDKEDLARLRDKDPAVRQAAAESLKADDSKGARDALVKAAGKDEDLLVVLAAIDSLSERDAASNITKELTDLALESPFTSVRRRAAEAFGTMDVETARTVFLKKVTGKTILPAARALASSLESATSLPARDEKAVRKDVKKLKRMLGSKDTAEEAAAARTIMALSLADAAARASARKDLILDRATDVGFAGVVCGALDSITAAATDDDLEALVPLIAVDDLPSVVERRLLRAIESVLTRDGEGAQRSFFETQLKALDGSKSFELGPRLARLASLDGIEVVIAREALVTLLNGKRSGTRAAAAKALNRLGEAAVEVAVERLPKEDEPAPKRQLIEFIGRHGDVAGGVEGEPVRTASALLDILEAKGEEDVVREAAAVALGKRGVVPKIVTALAKVANDAAGEALGVTAAVALGRTRSVEAIEPLAMLTTHEDWSVRASAAAGLEQVSTLDCVGPLLALLEDSNSCVTATAHRALLRFSGRAGQAVDLDTWTKWWEENGARARFRTLDEEREASEKYGYAVEDSKIYSGLDVIVVPGRGDHIEGVLERLGIVHRTVQAGQLMEGGLHPGAILLVGCTGEIGAGDIEVVQWYVRAGGALFTSCWALSHTVEPSFPAVIRKFPTGGEVLDNVLARPTASGKESPYLTGVFDGDVEPFYSLVGAHLIEVVDPERATVVLDSPMAAARHGTGDLAAWFRAGHGVVLDTANHFAEQGFTNAKGLDKPVDRQAFAVNHMGLTPKKLRATQGEKWWRSSSKAANEIADLSVFRILTNFVREKRING